jgi:hypothetical protein
MAGETLAAALLGGGLGVLSYEVPRVASAGINNLIDPGAAEAGQEYGRRSPIDAAMMALMGLTGGLAGAGYGHEGLRAAALEDQSWREAADRVGEEIARYAQERGMTPEQMAAQTEALARHRRRA